MDDIIRSDKVIGGTTPMSPCKNCRSPGLLPRTSARYFNVFVMLPLTFRQTSVYLDHNEDERAKRRNALKESNMQEVKSK